MASRYKYRSAKDRALINIKDGGGYPPQRGCGSNVGGFIMLLFIGYVLVSKVMWISSHDPWLIWLPGNFLFGIVIKFIKLLTPLYFATP